VITLRRRWRAAVSAVTPPGPWDSRMLFIAVVILAAFLWSPLRRTFHVQSGLWLIDLDVYRSAGQSVLAGRPVYQHLTPSPQLLPFTYPPVAAVLAMPLAILPSIVAAWLWTISQLVILGGILAWSFRSVLVRTGRWYPVALAVLLGGSVWVLPVWSGIQLGQVNIFLMALVLADFMVTQPRWPRGILIGLVTAVKLTPGVFIVHLWLTGRRREAWTAIISAAAFEAVAFLVIPWDSVGYWASALFDSGRLGYNASVDNQSLRGMMLRIGPDGSPGSALWVLCAVVVAVAGFRYALRASRCGNEQAAVAIVGILAVLLSPVAWIHHLAWVVVGCGVLIGDGRSVRRIALAMATWAYFTVNLSWRGRFLHEGGGPFAWFGYPMEQAYCWGALGLLPLLAWAARQGPLRESEGTSAATSVPSRPQPALH
jgi:alpha-1,2-mannosyltransferase